MFTSFFLPYLSAEKHLAPTGSSLKNRTQSCHGFFLPKAKSANSLSVCCGSNRSRRLSVRQEGRRNICRLVALLPKPIWLRDSRLTSHLIRFLSSRPSLWSNSFRVTCNLWIWASLVRAISFTGRWMPENLAANNKIRQQHKKKNKKRRSGQITPLSAAYQLLTVTCLK